MSIKLTARVWALEDEDLKDARLLTLLSLADFATCDDYAWPSVPTLAKRTRISERQIQRSIHWLEQNGYIEITEKGNGRGRVTTYKLLIKGDIKDIKGDTMTPFDANIDTGGSIKGDIGNIKGDIGDENYSYVRREPLATEPTTEGKKEIAADAALPASTETKPVKPKRTRNPRKPPNTSEAPPPKEPAEWTQFLEAFCWICHGHKDISSLTQALRGQLVSEGKEIKDKGYTTDDLREWYKRVWGKSWQYQKSHAARPKAADVRSSIAQLRAETPEGFEVAPVAVNGNHVNGTSKVAGSLAALADYEQLKARHGITS